MTLMYGVFLASAALFGGSAVLALWWASRRGQLEDFQRGATSIFDADEPIGRRTDGLRLDDKDRRRPRG